ncbi:MAG: hypothetical protein SGI84_07670 [Gemmatimonadota bacterium]|nr:hypothetical protein [Gemmatimonadota bacterium]
MALTLALGGCYTLHPTYGVIPAVGEQVAFDINDAGRVALGGAMGPEIAQVEGLLLEHTDSEFRLAVSAIRLLRGGEQLWRGESVTLKPEYLGSAYVKRHSPGRSIALGVVTLGGFTALMLSTNLLGGGNEDPPGGGGDTVTLRLGRP